MFPLDFLVHLSEYKLVSLLAQSPNFHFLPSYKSSLNKRASKLRLVRAKEEQLATLTSEPKSGEPLRSQEIIKEGGKDQRCLLHRPSYQLDQGFPVLS